MNFISAVVSWPWHWSTHTIILLLLFEMWSQGLTLGRIARKK